jgi:Ca-activated chloride channel family protein
MTRLAVCLLLAVSSSAQFRSDVHLISVGFSVRDQTGNLVTTLTQDDFEVIEDGVPQKIAFFARSQDVPLSLGLIVDASGSQGAFVRQHDKDVHAFLQSILGKDDRAFLVSFGNRIRLVSDFSSSAADIMDRFEHFQNIGHTVAKKKGKTTVWRQPPDDPGANPFRELGPRGEQRFAGTAFYDAIYHSIGAKLADVDHGRRALVIFSDGEDNSSAHHMLDAIEAAQSSDVLLFCIRYTDTHRGGPNARNKYGTSVMERIARETGGMDFDARAKGLAEGFRQIGEQLRLSYELGYHSTNPVSDDSFHKISIRLKPTAPAGLTIRSKTGYFARSASTVPDSAPR